MFAKRLASMAALLPPGLKYQLRGIKKFYTRIMALNEPIVRVNTKAGNFNWHVDALTSQRFILGTYEPYMQEVFMAFVHSGDVVYDIGAHAGFHSCFLSLLVGSKGMVLAFEPNPQNLASIKKQIAINSNLPMKIFPYAVSDRNGTACLNVPQDTSQSFVAEHGALRVQSRSLDSLVEQSIIPPPKLIKIDVEGHEKFVLKGVVRTMLNFKPIILCDYNDSHTLSDVTEILSPLNYRIKEGPLITGF